MRVGVLRWSHKVNSHGSTIQLLNGSIEWLLGSPVRSSRINWCYWQITWESHWGVGSGFMCGQSNEDYVCNSLDMFPGGGSETWAGSVSSGHNLWVILFLFESCQEFQPVEFFWLVSPYSPFCVSCFQRLTVVPWGWGLNLIFLALELAESVIKWCNDETVLSLLFLFEKAAWTLFYFLQSWGSNLGPCIC